MASLGRETRRHPGPAHLSARPLRLAGAESSLRAAGLQYWEIDPSHWANALDGIVSLRIPMLRLDVPWVMHERARGIFDWGERRPELDLPRLLDLAAARGLGVLVCPGPWIGAHCPYGGLPARVLDAPDVRAVHPRAGDLPLHSRASEWLWREAEVWLRALRTLLARRQHPHGPVIAWIRQSGGPVPSPWGIGLLDRSNSARAYFAGLVRSRARGDAGTPGPPASDGPRSAAELPAALAWVRAGELVEQAALREAGPPETAHGRRRDGGDRGLPTLAYLDDSPPGAGADAGRLVGEVAGAVLRLPDWAGSDFATLRFVGLRAAEWPFVGVSGLSAAHSLFRPRGALDPHTAAAVLAMCGVRGLDLDGLHPRGGAWEYAAPLRSDGCVTPEAAGWREVFGLLDAIGHGELVRRRDCLLLVNREVARLREVTSSRGMPPALLGLPRPLEALRVDPRPLGLRDRPETEHDIQLWALFDGLRRAGIAFGIVDTSMPDETLSRARVLILPMFGPIGRPLAQRLLAWVEAGGVLVLGPRLPRADWSGGPLGLRLGLEEKERVSRLRLHGLELSDADLISGGETVIEAAAGPIAASVTLGSGRLVHFAFRLPWSTGTETPEGLAAVVTALLRPADVRPCYAASDPSIETELFEGQPRRFLFLANPTRADRRVRLDLAPREGVREVRGSARHVRGGDWLEIPARSVLLREVVEL